MSFSDLLRGPSTQKVSQGKTESVTYLVPQSQYPAIRAIKITYTPVTFKRRYLFPWVDPIQLCVWHLRVTVSGFTGRKYEEVVVSELPLDLALQHARLEGLRCAINAMRSECTDPAQRQLTR